MGRPIFYRSSLSNLTALVAISLMGHGLKAKGFGWIGVRSNETFVATGFIAVVYLLAGLAAYVFVGYEAHLASAEAAFADSRPSAVAGDGQVLGYDLYARCQPHPL